MVNEHLEPAAFPQGDTAMRTFARHSAARYAVGIDLGTTHTVVAYADLAGADDVHVFDVEQLVAPGEVAARPLLASVRYHPAVGELAPDDLRLPWQGCPPPLEAPVMGALALELGAQVPGRLIASAKSWLSHAGVDRTAAILPWGAAQDVAKVSPVDASASYLAYVRAAWNHAFADAPLECQDVVLTLPASFDEAARALTLEAARRAGLPGVRLLEEPQAALYDWLHARRGALDAALGGARRVLVCDVGGGTCDFTLVEVAHEQSGPAFRRVGVGDHLVLGGDNMDLALAHLAERRLAPGAKLSAAQLSQLLQQCRGAKERLLAEDAPQRAGVTVLGEGGRLIGGALATELSRDEVRKLVLDGFFPRVGLNERPQRRQSALVEFGLPYAADPAVTRHLADFLGAHGPALPDAVLLNGGVFRARAISERVTEQLAAWRGGLLYALHNAHPELAVARGAVAYALSTRGRGPRIAGGSARSYFLVMEQREKRTGVCLLPKGTEPGVEVALQDRQFRLRRGEPVRFPWASSTAERIYRPGEIVDLEGDEFIALPPISATIAKESGEKQELPVRLTAQLSEIGTLEVYCVADDSSGRRWQLEFQIRSAAAPADERRHPRLDEALERISRVYGPQSGEVAKSEAKRLRGDLEQVLGARETWETALLRALFGGLWEGHKRRRRSADHERVWFNLAGYCLRPGFGYPGDDWRVQELWSLFAQGVQYTAETQVWAEWWTLWRRVSGGMSADAQTQLFEDLAYYIAPPGRLGKKPPGPKKLGFDDMTRLAGALERIAVACKVEAGGWLLQRLRKPGEHAAPWWALGRLGARVPFYGSAHSVVPRDVVSIWIEQALRADWKAAPPAAFAAALMARVSGDRERDVEETLREQVAQRLTSAKAAPAWVRMVREQASLEAADEQRMFGDSLPAGLRLVG